MCQKTIRTSELFKSEIRLFILNGALSSRVQAHLGRFNDVTQRYVWFDIEKRCIVQ